ncbi:hypothetical protein MKX03_018001 [Papaver bracteatum]|nr:hypothetical protein MKX03_018001 [Papaver bracteatum]
MQEHLLVEGLELPGRKDNDLIRRNFPISIEVLKSFIKQSSYHGSPRVTHDIFARVHEISALPPKYLSDVECLDINNTRRKFIIRKEPDVNNLIRRKKAKKGFQTAYDKNFTNHAPPTRDFGVLKKHFPDYFYFSGVLTICVSKNSIFFGSMNKLIQEKLLSAGYLHSITDSNSSSRLNSSNWISNYEASFKMSDIHNKCEDAFSNPHGVYEIPGKPPWLVFLLCKTLRREDATVHCTPYQATTIIAKVLSKKGKDLPMLLVADVHLGNIIFQMESFKGGDNNIYVINLGEIWDKLVMAGMVTISIKRQQDVIFQSARAYEQRGVLKFAYYIGTQRLAVRHTLSTTVDNIKESKLYHLQVPWISVHIIVVSCGEREYFTSALVH